MKRVPGMLTIAVLMLPSIALAHEYGGPQGSVQIDWSAPGIARVVSSGYGDSFGMEAAVKMGFPEIVEIDGTRCIDGGYLLFDVDDAFAFDIDETVTLELVLYKRKLSRLAIAWDRNALAESLMYVDLDAAKGDMLTQRIELPRARFANRGEAGTDLVIGGASVYFPGVADDNHNIVLCGLRILRAGGDRPKTASGSLELTVTDDKGKPTAVRAGIYDASGRMPLPSRDALDIDVYDDHKRQVFLRETHGKITPWPHDNRYVFYFDGRYAATLPAGNYKLVLSKGPEYRFVEYDFEVGAGDEVGLAFKLERFADLPATGWYSGDDHVHVRRLPKDNENIARLMTAEDIHVTNVLQMGNPANPYFLQYAFGNAGRYFDGHHGLVSGIEDPRTALRGHTISLNIQEAIRRGDIYLQYDRVFAEYAKQGGISGYAHVAGEWFNAERGLALDVPLGGVDFIEVLQDGQLGTRLWYDFLNLGFALVPTAGSDFPYLNQPGAERNYVHVGKEFSADQWFEILAAGKTYVTNGPLLTFTLGDAGMGDTIDASAGDKLLATATVRLNPDFERLDRLELVVAGEVIATVNNDSGAVELKLGHELTIERGVWVAVRAFGTTEMAAHSAPVYVSTDSRGFRNDAAVPEIVARMLAKLAEFESLEVDVGEELEVWEAGPPLEKALKEQRPQILQQTDRARAIYNAILEDTRTWH